MIVMIVFAAMEIMVWIACLHVLGTNGIPIAILFSALAAVVIVSEIENMHHNKRDDFRRLE